MNEKETCGKPAGHKAHMCQLKHEGRIEEIDRHSAHPRFACNKCGARADDDQCLCNPRTL